MCAGLRLVFALALATPDAMAASEPYQRQSLCGVTLIEQSVTSSDVL
jgi:hypothetical protein